MSTGHLPPPPIAPPPHPPQQFVPLLPSSPKRRGRGTTVAIMVGGALVGAVAVIGGFLLVRDDSNEYSYDAATQKANDEPRSEYEMTVTLGSVEITAEGTTDLDNDVMTIQMDLREFSPDYGEISMVLDLDEEVVYVERDSFAGLLSSAPTKYVSMTLEQLEDAGSLEDMQIGPRQTAALFLDASTVKDRGFEDLAGERVRHFEVIVDWEDLIEVQPSMNTTYTESNEDEVPDVVEYDVYVTKDNQIRLSTYELEMGSITASTEMTLIAVGDDVDDIELPDDDDVTTFDELTGG
jgi:hypothetical protein